ncbi:hypothetical protein [uncultured Psychroserpens sp.]|uniref:hypothetical protein n=1 Tax=uncultured Psychroserpens sp. TaxID=255436 RepID=UPI00260AD7D5|nr:hypothetical protein [uncultured Psychroserpens sp.]
MTEYSDSFIIYEGIEFIAVFKKKFLFWKYYVLRVGYLENKDEKSVERVKIFQKNIDDIPSYLPIPNNRLHITSPLNKNETKNKPKYIRVYKKPTERISIKNYSEKGKYEFLRVYTEHYETGGTVGGLFSLSKFPNELFGISNWHVIKGKSGKLGDPIYKHYIDSRGRFEDKRIVGNLFWASKFNEIDAAIFHFNFDSIKDEILKKDILRGVPIINKIGVPEIGKRVLKKGVRTGETEGKILSDNTTIKFEIEHGKNKEIKIFRNQIMVEKISDDGDSGSILFSEDKKAIGLIFASNNSDSGQQMSLACNINDILNRDFKPEHPGYYRKKNITIKKLILTN